MSEHTEQVSLFNWAKVHETRHPELGLLHAIPNGGDRHPAVAAKLKAEGVKSGVPDMFLPVPTPFFHGLYIEMKFGRNKLSPAQKEWRGYLLEQGYNHHVCYTWICAARVICVYLGLKKLIKQLN